MIEVGVTTEGRATIGGGVTIGGAAATGKGIGRMAGMAAARGHGLVMMGMVGEAGAAAAAFPRRIRWVRLAKSPNLAAVAARIQRCSL